ncbi:MAG: ATP-binding protein [Leptospirales bacterium]|nr:ATP-binding protein [Leptospirales bacterium]
MPPSVDLSQSIQSYQKNRDFSRSILIYLAVLFAVEAPAGLVFAGFFLQRIETERSQDYRSAWDNYVHQRLAIHHSKLTGYAWWDEPWRLALAGRLAEMRALFEEDLTLSSEFDYFAVYLDPGGPAVELRGSDRQQLRLPDPLARHLFATRSMQAGDSHLVAQLSDGRWYLLSASALCRINGAPMTPGVELVAYDLERFMRKAEEVIPVTLRLGNRPDGEETVLALQGLAWPAQDLKALARPRQSALSLTLPPLLFMLGVQVLISLALFAVLAPRYGRRHSQRLSEMLDAARALNLELARSNEELNQARLAAIHSEIKYRHLVEDARELILSLTPQGDILSVNIAIEELLGCRRDDVLGRPLADLVHQRAASAATIGVELLREKLREACGPGGVSSFSVALATRHQEPVELQFRVERIDAQQDGPLLFARASTILEDNLLRYVRAERKYYEFGNYLTIGEQVGQRITENLQHYLDADETNAVRFGVREMILNAIEHGNLGITFHEKSEAIRAGEYFHFMNERQQDQRFRQRRVRVYYSLTQRHAAYIIADEGAGFDHRAALQAELDLLNAASHSHGRGIVMSRQVFDIMRYNERGNRVFLLKRFAAATPA